MIIFKDRTNEEPGKSGEQRFKGQARGGGRAASQRFARRERGRKEGWKREQERDAGRCLVPGSLQTCGESVTDLRSSGKCLIFGRQGCCIDGMVERQWEAKSEAHLAELMMQTTRWARKESDAVVRLKNTEASWVSGYSLNGETEWEREASRQPSAVRNLKSRQGVGWKDLLLKFRIIQSYMCPGDNTRFCMHDCHSVI